MNKDIVEAIAKGVDTFNTRSELESLLVKWAYRNNVVQIKKSKVYNELIDIFAYYFVKFGKENDIK